MMVLLDLVKLKHVAVEQGNICRNIMDWEFSLSAPNRSVTLVTVKTTIQTVETFLQLDIYVFQLARVRVYK